MVRKYFTTIFIRYSFSVGLRLAGRDAGGLSGRGRAALRGPAGERPAAPARAAVELQRGAVQKGRRAMIVNREVVVEAQMIVVVAIELVQVLASSRGAPEMYACMYVCGCQGERAH